MSARPQPSNNNPQVGLDFAWKTYSSTADWTAKVDSKAAIILSLGGVLLGSIVILSVNNKLFTDLLGWRAFARNTGLFTYCIGILLAAFVVLPRLGRKTIKKEGKENYIYFGDIRLWNPKDLAKKISSMDENEAIRLLSAQLVKTAEIVWIKHKVLQFSMFFYLIGIVVLALAIIWPK